MTTDEKKIDSLFLTLVEKSHCVKHNLTTRTYCLKCVTELQIEQIETAKKEVAKEIFKEIESYFLPCHLDRLKYEKIRQKFLGDEK